MCSYPDFSPQGYQIISELGRNREGGRITWLALDLNIGQQVVLKQFCFAQVGSSWSAFRAHEREIEVLQGLNHPGIPRYLGAFETQDGFCLVQEYKNAPTLAVPRSFEPEEIKRIAVKVLEILVYLQNRIPPVIHRDIKPENILVDDQLNVYLIDFGMSRIGSQEVSASSVFQGTPGFMPPEQIYQPKLASDLYGLGATLICLLTGTRSTAIQDLTDEDNRYLIHFRHLLPRLSLRFISWLEKMVQPSLRTRFANAQTALEALIPLDVIRAPGIELSPSALEFRANRLGERLTQTITVENPIPDTVLEGTWEVTAHPQDPPHTPDAHAWISVEPIEFACNHTVCHIQVDTSKLMADQLYQRQLLLRTNAYPEIYPLTVRVQTAPLPIERRKVPYAWLAGLLLICAIASMAMTWFIAGAGLWAVIRAAAGVGVGFVIVFVVGLLYFDAGDFGAMVGIVIGFVFQSLIGDIFRSVFGDVNGVIVLNVIGVVVLGMFGHVVLALLCGVVNMVKEDIENMSTAILLVLLTIGLGTSFGIGCIVGLLNPFILLALAGTGLPLATMLVFPPLQRRRFIAKYRQSEERLIKP
ncbi:serine/threonine protein kinase [Tolypothrix campylonemoides VB511288]|nr:serine/threonine protein kinase [Tolypothrix campylonemoides VB511288]